MFHMNTLVLTWLLGADEFQEASCGNTCTHILTKTTTTTGPPWVCPITSRAIAY